MKFRRKVSNIKVRFNLKNWRNIGGVVGLVELVKEMEIEGRFGWFDWMKKGN